jgi:ribonuclease HII
MKNSAQTFFPFYEAESQDLWYFEKKAKKQGYKQVAGLYVEGAYALAGPIVTAICILPPKFSLQSVEATPKFYHQITAFSGLFYAIEIIEPEQIRQDGVFSSITKSMETSFLQLSHKPDFTLIHGPYHPFSLSPSQYILQGNTLSLSIACAFALAKTTRDAIMQGYHDIWPSYSFCQNKGFATTEHIKKIKELGPSPAHIKSN